MKGTTYVVNKNIPGVPVGTFGVCVKTEFIRSQLYHTILFDNREVLEMTDYEIGLWLIETFPGMMVSARDYKFIDEETLLTDFDNRQFTFSLLDLLDDEEVSEG